MTEQKLKLVGKDEQQIPPGAVLLGQPDQDTFPRPEELSFVDLIGLAFTKADQYLAESRHGSAKREYALAKTACEDAVMRFNRGRTMDLGVFNVTDTEDPAFQQMVAQIIEQAKADAGETPQGGGDAE